MSDAVAKYLIVAATYLLIFGFLVRTYGRRLDNVICDAKPPYDVNPAKLWTNIAGGAWTYYMLVARPSDVRMWAIYFCAVAATELFKKLMSMWFERVAPPSLPPPQQPTLSATINPQGGVVMTAAQPAAPAASVQGDKP